VARRKLYAWLRANHFGCLQRSVWLSPDPFGDVVDVLKMKGVSAGDVVAVEGRPCVGGAKSDAGYVASAWKWEEINGRYSEYIDFSRNRIGTKMRPAAARDWVSEERSIWMRAVRFDPLLPEALLPEGYLGKKAWEARRKLLKRAVPMVAALDGE
jgi:DNA-binding transcriptional regulator PaaX